MIRLRFHFIESDPEKPWLIDSPDLPGLRSVGSHLKACLRDAISEARARGIDDARLLYVFANAT